MNAFLRGLRVDNECRHLHSERISSLTEQDNWAFVILQVPSEMRAVRALKRKFHVTHYTILLVYLSLAQLG